MHINDYIDTLIINKTSSFGIAITIRLKGKTYGTYLEYLNARGQDTYEYVSKVETWIWTGNIYSDDIERENRLSQINIARYLYEN